MPAQTIYRSSARRPVYLQVGATTAVTCAVELEGAPATVTAATWSLLDAAGNSIASGSGTPSGSPTGTTVGLSVALAATVKAQPGCQLELTATIGGSDHIIRYGALVVRRVLHCPVVEADLYRLYRTLDPEQADTIAPDDGWEPKLAAAWDEVEDILRGRGRRPDLITDSSALHKVTLETALALIFREIGTRQPAYQQASADHAEAAKAAWRDVSLAYEGTQVRRSASGPMFLGRG